MDRKKERMLHVEYKTAQLIHRLYRDFQKLTHRKPLLHKKKLHTPQHIESE